MDLKKYFLPILKWWWLLVLATVLAGGVSYYVVSREPEIYEARTTLMIGRAINEPNPTTGEFVLGTQMASAYADIAKRQLIRDATRKALGLQRLPEYNAQALLNTQIIEIIVKDPNPALAQRVANELANQLILLSPGTAESADADRQEFVNGQLNSLEIQIQETEAQIEQLQVNLGSMISAKEIADTKSQIFALETKINTLQTTFSEMLSNSNEGASNTITVIEPAALPARPVESMKLITVALAMAVGMSLSGSAAYLLEYLDGAVKSQDEIEVLFNTPVVGSIFEVKQGKNKQPFSIADNPRHPVTEAFRNLRTFLEFARRDKPHTTILVTSAGSNDGKTWIAANLAISMAKEGKKVVLIDADLRNPSLHQFFHEERENGLTDVFQGKRAITDVIKYNNEDRVGLITAGELPQNTYELMNFKIMEKTLKELKGAVDTVIIDSPPFFIADSVLMASLVDSVLAIVRPNHTLKQSAKAMIEQIHRSGGNLTGVVINRIPFRQLKFYMKYPYTSLEKYHLASERMQKEPR